LLYTFRDMPYTRVGFGRAGHGRRSRTRNNAAAKRWEQVVAADELAQQGRFVDAMHVLLLQGLADIRRHLDEQFADSLTSREILRSTKLSDQGRVSLRDIITRVEWTYFGEHPAGSSDYAACRDSFNALARALHGTAAS
jgi:hypothetical protein